MDDDIRKLERLASQGDEIAKARLARLLVRKAATISGPRSIVKTYRLSESDHGLFRVTRKRHDLQAPNLVQYETTIICLNHIREARITRDLVQMGIRSGMYPCYAGQVLLVTIDSYGHSELVDYARDQLEDQVQRWMRNHLRDVHGRG